MKQDNRYQVGIIGGGFTGLAAAVCLLQKGVNVCVLEKSNYLGGLASTFDTGSYEIEKFYHQWYAGDEGYQWLLELIGRTDKESTVSMKHGFYFRQAVWRTKNPFDHFRYSGLTSTDSMRMAYALWRLRGVTDWRTIDQFTVRDWFIKYANEGIYERFWKQLLLARFGNHADDISVVWVWQKLKRDQNSKPKKKKGQVASYYEGGFSALFDDIEKHIVARDGRIVRRTEIKGIEHTEDKRYRVVGSESDTALSFDRIIITTPLPEAGRILKNLVDAKTIEEISAVRHLDSRGIILRLRHSLSDLYWVANRDLSFPFVGVIEHTQFRPPSDYAGEHIVYLSQTVAPGMAEYEMADDAYIEFGLQHVEQMFENFSRDSLIAAHTWRADNAQPLVSTNYHKRLPQAAVDNGGVLLATQAHVYPDYRGTHTAIRAGRAVGEAAARALGV